MSKVRNKAGDKKAAERRRALLATDPNVVQHGTIAAYRNWACRCVPCKNVNTVTVAAARKERADRLALDPTAAPHGRNSTYLNWACRCTPCRDAHAEAGRR